MKAPPKELINRYTGSCIGAQQLNDFLGEVNGWFQSQGWVTTRAYFEAQKKLTERLLIRVVPGRIEKITLNGRADDPRIASAFPLREQRLLNLRDLEQGLEKHQPSAFTARHFQTVSRTRARHFRNSCGS